MDQKRILIVDDEVGFTHLLKLTLEKTKKFIVREENDGTKAWLTARDFKPDLIFLDIVMPKIDGGDVASKLQADPSLKGVPIIFLTAIVSQKEAGKESAIGGFPFLAKPVSLEAVLSCIQKHLGSVA